MKYIGLHDKVLWLFNWYDLEKSGGYYRSKENQRNCLKTSQ